MFYHCTNLEYLDISSIKTISGAKNTLFSDDIETEGKIKIHENIKNDIESILPKNWDIDDTVN